MKRRRGYDRRQVVARCGAGHEFAVDIGFAGLDFVVEMVGEALASDGTCSVCRAEVDVWLADSPAEARCGRACG